MKRFLTITFSFLMFFGFASFISIDTYAAGPWTHNGIIVDKSSPQPENTSIKLTANVSGDKSGLQYKFVWMRNNWKSWGVLKAFNTTNSITWIPTTPGTYTIFLDVRDAKGRIVTKTINYVATTGWSNNGIIVDKSSPQPENTSIKLTAKVSGPRISGLQYKYVWMKDNWKSWGVLKAFNTTNSITWTPTTPGTYTIYLDVRDAKGRIVTKTLNYSINTGWNHNGISVDKVSPQPENTSIKLTGKASGPRISGLQYKYVWMKDNWKSWGVLKAFNTTNSITWTPTTPGTYTIYLDVRDAKGRIVTKTINYVVAPGWNNNGISVDKKSPQLENTSIKLTANVSGPRISGLQYKYVWMKDNWKSWGVLKAFNTTNNTAWTPKTPGNYTLYLDVRDAKGRTVTKTLNYKINPIWWSNNGITLNIGNVQELGATFKLTANTSGNTSGLQYKFVWMKNNWKSWGVIKDFNSTNNTTWKPREIGIYTLYLDIRDKRGKTVTKTKTVYINRIPGINISQSYGDINWRAVKDSGKVKFAMIRSGCGYYDSSGANGKIDSKFYQNVKNAKAVGMPIGVYHESYATSIWEAEREADYCLSIIKKSGAKFEYPIVFTIVEYDLLRDKKVIGNKPLFTNIVKAFCNKIEKAGYYAAVCAASNYFENYLDTDKLGYYNHLWVSQAGKKPSRYCGMLSYCGRTIIPGITRDLCGANYSYRDYPSIMKYKHLNGY